MDTEQERALLPYPFCGGTDLKLFGEYAPEWWVCCEACKAATQTRTNKSQAVEDWNRRAALQPAEPVKVPSDEAIWSLAASLGLGQLDAKGRLETCWRQPCDIYDEVRDFARALLARYGQPAQPAASAEPDVVLRVVHNGHEIADPEVVRTSKRFDDLPAGAEVKLYTAPVAAQPSAPEPPTSD